MDSRLVALKLFLTELDIPSEIDTIDDRKRVQKAVYLGQLTGVDLGYRFGWYLLGPYSPALTRDYYALAEALVLDGNDIQGKALHPAIRERLHQVLPLMKTPGNVRLSQEEWLELVASYHYLRSVRKLSRPEAMEILEAQKPALAPLAEAAISQLNNVDLLPDS